MSGFKEGELVLSCAPYSYVLLNQFKNQYCDFCFKENNQLKKCSRCSFTYYCDKNCQTKAWDMHQAECKYLKIWDGEKPDGSVRAFALIILKIKRHGVDKPFVEVGGRKISFATLMSHAEDIKQDSKLKTKLELAFEILQKYIGSENTPSFDELTEIIGKTIINSFTILDITSTECIGKGLYLGASVFDHSCDPDALVVFDGTTLNVRMRRNVPHRNIREIHISYLNGSMKLTEERRIPLLEKYYFHCECEYCNSFGHDDLMMKLLNTDKAKEKALACQKEFKEKKQRLRNLLMINPQLALEECKKLLKAQSDVLADSNIYKIKTLRIALDACFNLNASKDVIKMASSLEKYIRLYYRNIHFELASFLLYYGQHLCLLGHKKEGESKISESDNMFKIIYGVQHPFYKAIKNFINALLHSNVQRI